MNKELSDDAQGLLLFLTRSTIPKLYSHIERHKSVGWRNICSSNYNGDPRVSAPPIMVKKKPLTREPIKELSDAGLLEGSFSGVMSVSEQGFAKAKAIRDSLLAESVPT